MNRCGTVDGGMSWQDAANNRLMDVTRLLLEPEATTDREESLSRYVLKSGFCMRRGGFLGGAGGGDRTFSFPKKRFSFFFFAFVVASAFGCLVWFWFVVR